MHPIPLWIKVIYTLFLCVLVPVYARKYPPANFLWFSDIALITTAAAMWLNNSLLASMMALAITLPEIAWNFGFFGHLIFGRDVAGLAGYMFDPKMPLYLRGLSLFHIFLPPLLIWIVYRLGYDRRALMAQIVLMVTVLTLTYLLTSPSANINWVFGPGTKPQSSMPPPVYLLLLMAFFAVAVYFPTHLLLSRLFS
jgi:hypothetical protein